MSFDLSQGADDSIEVAAINAPLDVFIVRKLGVPGQEELAMGAIASGGVAVFNKSIVDQFNIPAQVLQAVIASEIRMRKIIDQTGIRRP